MPTQSLRMMAANFLDRDGMKTLTVAGLINELEAVKAMSFGDVPVYMTYEGCYDIVSRVVIDSMGRDPDNHCIFLSGEDPIT